MLQLCKDSNFSLPSKRLKFENYALPFERLYRDVYERNLKDESLLQLKTKIKVAGLLSYRIFNRKDYRYKSSSQEEYDAFINLSNNKKQYHSENRQRDHRFYN